MSGHLTGLPDLAPEQQRERLLQQLRRDAAWMRFVVNELDLIGLLLRDNCIGVSEAEAWRNEIMGGEDEGGAE